MKVYKTATSKQIAEIYRQVADQFSEHSTTFLLEITAERVRLAKLNPNCDSSDVVDALIKEGIYK